MANFAAGDKPTASQVNDLAPRFVRKTVNESLTTNTTIQNDDELVIAVAASTNYEVDCYLIWNSPAAADFKLQWSTPAGVSGYWTPTTQNLAAGAGTVYQGALAWATQAQLEGQGADTFTRISGVLTTTAAGNLQLQWAQNAASGTTTVGAHSFIKLTKVQ